MWDVHEVELEPGEILEASIGSCLTMLKRPTLTNHDRQFVQKMLTCAQALKQKNAGRSMSSLPTKYGAALVTEVLQVEEPLDKVE